MGGCRWPPVALPAPRACDEVVVPCSSTRAVRDSDDLALSARRCPRAALAAAAGRPPLAPRPAISLHAALPPPSRSTRSGPAEGAQRGPSHFAASARRDEAAEHRPSRRAFFGQRSQQSRSSAGRRDLDIPVLISRRHDPTPRPGAVEPQRAPRGADRPPRSRRRGSIIRACHAAGERDATILAAIAARRWPRSKSSPSTSSSCPDARARQHRARSPVVAVAALSATCS